MEERQSVALELLQDEALAAERARTKLLLEGDADGDALGGAEEGVLLTDQRATVLPQIGGMMLPG